MTSELPTRPMPPPTQKPLTALITGTGQSYTAAKAAKQPLLAPIRASKPSVFCISLMSTPALKPRPSARRITDPHVAVLTQAAHLVGQLEPLGHGERVDRRAVLHDLGDAVVGDGDFDPHGRRR